MYFFIALLSENLIIFSGGMPRASYSEKYTVTVYGSNGKTHVVLDFTSKVIDFTHIESDRGEQLKIKYGKKVKIYFLVRDEQLIFRRRTRNFIGFG